MNTCEQERKNLKRYIDTKSAEADEAYQHKEYQLWKNLADDVSVVLNYCPYFSR